MQTIKRISRLAKPIILGSMIVITSGSSTFSSAATPLDTGLSNESRLTLSRTFSKNRQNIDLDNYIEFIDKRNDAFDANNSECGNVEIGNVERPRIGQNIQPVNVTIVGNVINVPGGC